MGHRSQILILAMDILEHWWVWVLPTIGNTDGIQLQFNHAIVEISCAEIQMR